MAVIGYSWLTGISRNPEASKEMFTPGIIALALAEFLLSSLFDHENKIVNLYFSIL